MVNTFILEKCAKCHFSAAYSNAQQGEFRNAKYHALAGAAALDGDREKYDAAISRGCISAYSRGWDEALTVQSAS